MASIAPATPSEIMPRMSMPILAAIPADGEELDAVLEAVVLVTLLLVVDAAPPVDAVDAVFEVLVLLAVVTLPLELAVALPLELAVTIAPESSDVEDAPETLADAPDTLADAPDTLVDDVPEVVAVAEAENADEDVEEHEVELSAEHQHNACLARSWSLAH